jgi:hypothetical protein
MAKSASGGGPGEPEGLPQDPYVERLKPDPSQPAKRVVDLTGLPGNSDRPGYQRLYLTTKLDYYAEFLASDMVHSAAVPLDQSPFPGHEATRVSVARDATIHYIWARSPQPVDEFDLDIRLGAPGAAPAAPALQTRVPPCTLRDGCGTDNCTDACPTQINTCPHTGCPTCAPTCPQTCGQTCPQTCATCLLQNTCAGHGTCVNTQCVQAACIFTQGNQNTCVHTACQQATCVTCPNIGYTCYATCVLQN